MKIVFDLDGVLRDLNLILCKRYNIPYPQNWFWSYNGKNVYDYVKQDYSVLIDAPKTDFVDLLNGNIEIWSYQPQDWIKYTNKWLSKYFKEYTILYLTPEQKYTKLIKNNDIYLVEDYPYFKSYDKIILIDKPYNQKVNAKIRIKSAQNLKNILDKVQFI